MEATAVNIAAVLLHDKALTNRPPSGKRERDKFINNYARQLSSKAAKNYRPGSANIRQNHSPSTSNVKLFVKVEPQHRKTQIFNSANAKDEQSAARKRRVQSAKARLTNSDVSKSKPKLVRGQSARVRWGTNDTKTADNFIPATYLDLTINESGRLGPSVSGHKGRNRKCQSESDVSKLGKPLKSCLKGSAQNVYSQGTLASKSEEGLTDEALGVVADDEDTEGETDDEVGDTDSEGDVRLPLPKTLRPLAHWWTPDIPPKYLGIDHLRCWVFLPSMVTNYDQLPVVPGVVTDPTEPLPYKEIIHEPKPWAPKKYTHPWTKRPVEEHTCKHGAPVPPLKIYSKEGRLVHETHSDRRTVGVVRREIAELEDLLRGIGSADSCSLVVQYQHEINQLQTMVDNTLGRVEEIEKREREKKEALERKITDYCGLRKFCKEHDEVMRQIRLQHSRCVRELAILERRLKIDSARAHFRKESKAIHDIDTSK